MNQVRSNPKLAWDSNLISQYTRLGGTLSNGGIPVQSNTPAQSTASASYSSPSAVSAQKQSVKPPIPEWIYQQTTQAVMNGSLSPQQALQELQNLTASGGQFSGAIDRNKLFPSGTSFQRNGDTYSFDNTGTGNVIKTSATNQYTNISSKGISSGVPVDDPDFQRAFSGEAQAGNYGRTPNGIVNLTTGQLYDNNSVISALATTTATQMAQSGMTVNPNVDFKLVSWADFMDQAGQQIAPQYKEKFDIIKNTVTTGLSRISEDLGLKKDELGRSADEARRSGQETLAERGLTFSGQRQSFDTKLSEELNRSLSLADTSAFRGGQDLLNEAEQKVGTSGLQGISLPSLGSRSLSFGATPLKGDLSYQQYTDQFNRAQSLASDENARKQYAYNLSNRSF